MLCLQGGRFQAEAVWRTATDTGNATAVRLSRTSGLFWFFSDDNAEILVKVLDACRLPGFESYWVFYAATTDVDFTLTVTDTVTGITKEYMNSLGTAALPVTDTLTFPCD